MNSPYSKILSFSGAQSTGKTTLLNLVKEKYKDQIEVFPEITRQLKEKGFVINEAGTDETQRAVITCHENNLESAIIIANRLESNVLMDRCIWDGMIYTNWLYNNTDIITDETMNYAYESFDLMMGSYDVIFYTNPYDVKLVDDGERSASVKFRDEIIEMFENSFLEASKHTEIVRLKGSPSKRMKIIEKYLK